MAQETPQSTQVPTEVVATEEPTPAPIDEIKAEAETNLTAIVIVLVGSVIVGLVVLLRSAILMLGRSVPDSFAGVYFNAAYGVEKSINDRFKDLKDAASKSPAAWDDPVAELLAKLSADELQKVVDAAATRGVVVGGGQPQG